MQKYSIFSLIKNALTNHENWEVAWKNPEPKKEYDIVIIGGGGHGLATAYYLAKEHKITNIAILEKEKQKAPQYQNATSWTASNSKQNGLAISS